MDYPHESSSVQVVKRAEHIADLIVQLREPLIDLFMGIWTKVYKDETVPRTKWLQQFQLSLKVVKDLTDDEISEKLSHKKRVLSNLYEALMMTAYIHHDRAAPHISKEKVLLFHFARDCAVHIGRELWTKPYLFYNITHKKAEVVSAREAIEKLMSSAIKFQVRKMTEDIMIIENERIEKCRDIMDSESDNGQSQQSMSMSMPSRAASIDITRNDLSLQLPQAVQAYPTLSAPASPTLSQVQLPAPQIIHLNNQPMALVPLANIPSPPGSVRSLPAHSPASPMPSPPQSVRSVDIGMASRGNRMAGRNNNKYESGSDDDDDLVSNHSSMGYSVQPPGSPKISALDYIPLKKDTLSNRASSEEREAAPTKSIVVHKHVHHLQNNQPHHAAASSSDTSSVRSASLSSSSSEASVVVEKSSIVAAPKAKKPKNSLQKYGHYGRNSAVLAMKKKKKQTFY